MKTPYGTFGVTLLTFGMDPKKESNGFKRKPRGKPIATIQTLTNAEQWHHVSSNRTQLTFVSGARPFESSQQLFVGNGKSFCDERFPEKGKFLSSD
ncbi:hypothetical protein TNIN_65071 [Trichonephila inaurata madagascariensis]|uniref:Uncharacterized protein n=1 Tax=Trichonephila inaurata madagascariensis TaxID=2747483 RepID=A0A8X6WPZ4_9ARAC|nr:hypothetical protein TNIN_65071 [Trichonephila inaurata madagascariensis]